jgi:type IV pilus assembly protein PilC
MSVFLWEGKNSEGKRVKGQMEAATSQQVYNALRSQRINPNVKKIREKGNLDREIRLLPKRKKKVKLKDLVVFTRQFATMIDAGLPLVQGLDVLGKQNENPTMREILLDVKEQVQSGGTLADGLRRHPKTFDELFTNMIDAGEAGGVLDVVLQRMAEYLEKSDKLRRQIKTAMIYPGVVVSAAILVTSILLIFVIPTFADLFNGFGAALPAPTRIVIAMSNFMLAYWYLIFGSMFGSVYFFRKFAATERGKETIHPLALKAPVFGDLIRKVAVARFSRTLSTMISSGVPILEALNICARTSGNRVVEREITRVRISISEGKSITEPLEGSQIFPGMVVSMIGVGEQTGAMDAMLGKIADFYEDEVDNAVNGLKQLIEPLMILVLGGLIGGLVIAMYLPIFKLGSVIE